VSNVRIKIIAVSKLRRDQGHGSLAQRRLALPPVRIGMLDAFLLESDRSNKK
jgi:hypothetical protein